jgi:hypothetical protein
LAEAWDEYRAAAETAMNSLDEDDEVYRYLLCCVGMAAAHLGDPQTAESVISDHVDRGEFLYAGQVAAHPGNLDLAVEYLRRGEYKTLYRWDPDLQPLLGYEPFEELIRPKG